MSFLPYSSKANKQNKTKISVLQVGIHNLKSLHEVVIAIPSSNVIYWGYTLGKEFTEKNLILS